MATPEPRHVNRAAPRNFEVMEPTVVPGAGHDA
jgi:hypothetical protein